MKKASETVAKKNGGPANPLPSPPKQRRSEDEHGDIETAERAEDTDDGDEADLPVALDSQDPHALSGARDNVLEVAIGREVRAFRKKLGITVSDLARATGLSLGMLSKIENGVTSASLTTLQRLSRALGVPVTALFRRFEEKRDAVFVRAGQGLVIERRGTRAGHQYQLLGFSGGNATGLVVEPYMITLTEKSDVFPLFQHSGLEFLYMLEGEVVYRHGDKLYTMLPGDSLFFDADAPHGPEELVKLPIRFLSIISYAREREE
ncbi:MAG TPA: XRE family transcriptional regulator [Hyphomicrobium sp.]|jgi:transcriptional regulator with XRE-family HTH domain|nr:XRE family transcriptional regulator [Hyphomicrobium sp.]